jgi:anti-sigma B factor antagonist
VVVTIRGEIDSAVAEKLNDNLESALTLAATAPKRMLVVDLQRVSYFGSAGLNAIVSCQLAASVRAVAVRVVATGAAVLRPLRLTEIDRVLAIYPSVSAALSGGWRTGPSEAHRDG